MRFQGFELPIQFYDPDQPWLVVFPDGHGHFLHSHYIDTLFENKRGRAFRTRI